MTGQDEPYYCSEQIQIPPSLPDIMKQFTKAAIRTQPKDVLQWCSAYFNAMANGESPPVKERLEMPVATQKTDTGLTPGILRVLNKQLGPRKVVPVAEIENKWKELSLPIEQFQELCTLGNFTGDVEWLNFFALAAARLTENLTDTMKLLCELLTADAEGGPARVSFDLWKNIYRYLSNLDDSISKDHVEQVFSYLSYEVERQQGMVQPRNFLHKDCPPLH